MAPQIIQVIGNIDRPISFGKKSKINWSPSPTKEEKMENMKKKKNMTKSK